MLFGNKKKPDQSTQPTIEQLSAEHPDLFKAVCDQAVATSNVELADLRAKISALETTEKENKLSQEIKDYGLKLGVSAETIEECISGKMDLASSVKHMVDAGAKVVSNKTESASALFNGIVGQQGSSEDSDKPTFTTVVEAMQFIKKRDNCSAAEARLRCMNECPELMGKQMSSHAISFETEVGADDISVDDAPVVDAPVGDDEPVVA